MRDRRDLLAKVSYRVANSGWQANMQMAVMATGHKNNWFENNPALEPTGYPKTLPPGSAYFGLLGPVGTFGGGACPDWAFLSAQGGLVDGPPSSSPDRYNSGLLEG